MLIFSTIRASACLCLGCDQTTICFIYCAISKKMIKILSQSPRVTVSPCQRQPLCKPWQAADCHLPPLMHVDVPAAAFHLIWGEWNWWSTAHMEVLAIFPQHILLFWAMTCWAVYTSIFWIITYLPFRDSLCDDLRLELKWNPFLIVVNVFVVMTSDKKIFSTRFVWSYVDIYLFTIDDFYKLVIQVVANNLFHVYISSIRLSFWY